MTVSAQSITVSGDVPLGPASATMSTTKPNVTVTGVQDSDVTLLSYDTVDFVAALNAAVAPGVPSMIQDMLPYSVIVKNGSQKAIMAYTIAWTTIDTTGKRSTDFRTVCDMITLKPLILSGKGGLATIIGTLDTMMAATDERVRAEMSDQVRAFRNQSSIAISLEAVMFNDGTTTGPDRSLSIPQIKARLRAEYDVYTRVLEKTSAPGGPATVDGWLQTLASHARGGSHINLRQDAYAAWYQFYEARGANDLVRIAAAQGFDAMVTFVRAALQTKPYPLAILN